MPQIAIDVTDEQLTAVQYLVAHGNPLENLTDPASWAKRRLAGELEAAVLWYRVAFSQLTKEALDDPANAAKTRDELVADAKAILVDSKSDRKLPPPSEVPAGKAPSEVPFP